MVATQFAQHPKWSYHYLAALGMAVVDAIVLFGVFRLHTQEELLGPTQTDPSEAGSREQKYQQIFRSWAIQLMAVFSLLYVGIETTIGGWIVTVNASIVVARYHADQPPEVRGGRKGWVGQAGAALFPFMTGALTQKVGSVLVWDEMGAASDPASH
ncbi:hypothetical protein FRC10_005478 [Ceratobasidium sp. 414]|nr:hypothetical protein FRC10_005478 [Ceratobasidium sp. 414]